MVIDLYRQGVTVDDVAVSWRLGHTCWGRRLSRRLARVALIAHGVSIMRTCCFHRRRRPLPLLLLVAGDGVAGGPAVRRQADASLGRGAGGRRGLRCVRARQGGRTGGRTAPCTQLLLPNSPAWNALRALPGMLQSVLLNWVAVVMMALRIVGVPLSPQVRVRVHVCENWGGGGGPRGAEEV